jgi:hypothetical protein
LRSNPIVVAEQDENVVEEAVHAGALTRDTGLLQLLVRLRDSGPPESLLRAITTSLADRYYYGLVLSIDGAADDRPSSFAERAQDLILQRLNEIG